MSPVDPDQQNIWITVIYGDFDCCKYSSDSEGDLFSAAGTGASPFNASRSCAYLERRIRGQTYQAGHVDHSPLCPGEGAWYRGSHFAKVFWLWYQQAMVHMHDLEPCLVLHSPLPLPRLPYHKGEGMHGLSGWHEAEKNIL